MPVSVSLAIAEPLYADAIRVVLEATEEFSVVGCTDTVEDTVADVRRLDPDVVVVAARLGDGSGLAACSRILELGDVRTLALVLGASGREDHLSAALEAGALGYVTPDADVETTIADIHGVARGEARVPGLMLGAVLRGLVTKQRRGNELLQRFADLSRRERQILQLLTQGQDHHEIADRLVISPETARTHIQKVLGKLGVHSRLEAANLALEQGWFSDEGTTP